MIPDLEALQQELHDIDRERFEVENRIRDYTARGRGRGGLFQRHVPGPGGGGPQYARGPPHVGAPGRPGPSRARIPSFIDRQGSGAFVPSQGPSNAPEQGARNGRGTFASNGDLGAEGRGSLERHNSYGGPSPRGGYRDDRFGNHDGRGQDAVSSLPGPPPRKKVLSSAVVVGDIQVMVGETTGDIAPGIAKRPRDESDDNPALKKRNKRMFGALLGTLQRFKEEDAAARKSRLAQQREEALKRADAHAAEELQRAREHERQQLAQQRIAELNRKRELNAAAELKRMEIAVAKRYSHRAMLAKFLCTAAKPALLWKPAKHCADTILLEEQRQLDLSVWMEGEKAKLEEERQKIIDRTKAIIEQAEKTRNSAVTGRQPGTSGAPANGQMDVAPADGEEEEGEPEMAKEASEGDLVDAGEEEQGQSQVAADEGPEDRYEAKGAEHDEDHREEDGGGDEGDQYDDEKVAETVEDLLK
ncbi:probable pinin at C-terminar half [Coccomyxa sp. Obi]|nr:probable pinin at C-terminar half [Coccomyxa sp. Obi]